MYEMINSVYDFMIFKHLFRLYKKNFNKVRFIGKQKE